MKVFILSVCVLFTAVHACRVHDTQKRDGDIWVERGSFLMRCDIKRDGSWQTKVVGCVTPSGTHLMAGRSITESDVAYSCTDEGGVIRLKKRFQTNTNSNTVNNQRRGSHEGHGHGQVQVPSSNTQTCQYMGMTKRNNDTWRVGQFLMKCLVEDSGWRTETVGCVTPSGTQIRPGRSQTEGRSTYRCSRDANNVIRMTIQSN